MNEEAREVETFEEVEKKKKRSLLPEVLREHKTLRKVLLGLILVAYTANLTHMFVGGLRRRHRVHKLG